MKTPPTRFTLRGHRVKKANWDLVTDPEARLNLNVVERINTATGTFLLHSHMLSPHLFREEPSGELWHLISALIDDAAADDPNTVCLLLGLDVV